MRGTGVGDKWTKRDEMLQVGWGVLLWDERCTAVGWEPMGMRCTVVRWNALESEEMHDGAVGWDKAVGGMRFITDMVYGIKRITTRSHVSTHSPGRRLVAFWNMVLKSIENGQSTGVDNSTSRFRFYPQRPAAMTVTWWIVNFITSWSRGTCRRCLNNHFDTQFYLW